MGNLLGLARAWRAPPGAASNGLCAASGGRILRAKHLLEHPMSEVPDVPPAAAFAALKDDPAAVLVDVRTDAEWNFVGIPDLSALGKEVVLIPWQMYPTMQVNTHFTEHLRKAGVTAESKVYYLCRSGARSLAAGQAAQAAGFPHAFNVADGFEGPVDAEGHRGVVAGWKAEGLPWRQR
jgi:rhodanese-related sulfurtransferase